MIDLTSIVRKQPLICLKMYYIYEPYWKQDNADIKFWYFIKLK